MTCISGTATSVEGFARLCLALTATKQLPHLGPRHHNHNNSYTEGAVYDRVSFQSTTLSLPWAFYTAYLVALSTVTMGDPMISAVICSGRSSHVYKTQVKKHLFLYTQVHQSQSPLVRQYHTYPDSLTKFFCSSAPTASCSSLVRSPASLETRRIKKARSSLFTCFPTSLNTHSHHHAFHNK